MSAVEPCGASEAAPRLSADQQEALVYTDSAGRFCLRWEAAAPEGRLKLSFQDERGLLDAAERTVEAQPVLPFELEFVRAPRTLALETPDVELEVVTRAQPGQALDELPLTLLWTRTGAPMVTLLTRELRPGERADLRFASKELGGPGSGELRVRLGEGAHAAEARAEVVVTAAVRLRAPSTLELRAGGEGRVSVQVDSVAGSPDSGSVEALVGDRTVGIAEVSRGKAELLLALGAGPRTETVTVRYLPASPFWLPGPSPQVRVEIVPDGPFRALIWAATLLAVAVYVARGWQRPRASSRVVNAPPPAAATLRWQPAAKHQDSWVGRVEDSHTHTPIEGAQVLALFSGGIERRTVTQPDGTFNIAPPGPALRTGRLRVESHWHSSFEGELPSPGVVTITLVTRRRALLARLVTWTRRRGSPWASGSEPTPGELASSAEALADPKVATWARAVEKAAFGPEAVDSAEEKRVRALEPDPKA